jgi:hypothetical protein
MIAGSLDLHLIAVAQRCRQRHVAAVHVGAHCRIADIGMHGVGEIQRRGTMRQGDQAALGAEAEHLILE